MLKELGLLYFYFVAKYFYYIANYSLVVIVLGGQTAHVIAVALESCPWWRRGQTWQVTEGSHRVEV